MDKLTLKNVSPAAHLEEKSPPGNRSERKVGMFSNVFLVQLFLRLLTIRFCYVQNICSPTCSGCNHICISLVLEENKDAS